MLAALSRSCTLMFRVAVSVTPLALRGSTLCSVGSGMLYFPRTLYILVWGQQGGEAICCLTHRVSMFRRSCETSQKLYFPAITSKRPISLKETGEKHEKLNRLLKYKSKMKTPSWIHKLFFISITLSKLTILGLISFLRKRMSLTRSARPVTAQRWHEEWLDSSIWTFCWSYTMREEQQMNLWC